MGKKNYNNCIFWLYYAKGLLHAKLKQHNDAIASFTAGLDAKKYSQVLLDNADFAKEELTNHKQILRTAERNITNKSSSSADLSMKSSSVKLVSNYRSVIALFEELLNKSDDIAFLDFSSMFDIPSSKDDSKNKRLQHGYAHYYKGLSQLNIEKIKEAIESFKIANKLLPNFCAAYIEKANIYKEQKKWKKALKEYNEAIILESDNAELYFNRSLVLFELGRLLEAKNDFKKYQSLNSTKN